MALVAALVLVIIGGAVILGRQLQQSSDATGTVSILVSQRENASATAQQQTKIAALWTAIPSLTPASTYTLPPTWTVAPTVTSQPTSTPAPTNTRGPSDTPVPTDTPAPYVGDWTYFYSKSKLDDNVLYSATLLSNETYNDFLGTAHHVTLVVGCSTQYPNALFLVFNIDSFYAAELDSNFNNVDNVTLRFDKAPAKSYTMTQSADGKGAIWSFSAPLFKQFSNGHTLLYAFMPVSQSQNIVSFTLDGFSNVVQPMIKTCNISNFTGLMGAIGQGT